MINDFIKLIKLQYSFYLFLILIIVVFFEFASYGLAYPIITIFLGLDDSLIIKINEFIKSNFGIGYVLNEYAIVILLITTLLLQSLSFILFRYLTLKTTLEYLYQLRSKIYHLFFTSDFNSNIKNSDFLNALTIQSLNSFYYWNSFIDCIKRILIIIAIITLFIIISYKILFISILILSLLFLLINKISHLSKKYGKNMTIIDQEYINASSQFLKNYRYIKITNIKDQLFSPIQKTIRKFNLNQFYFTMLNKLIKEASEPVAIILIILIGYLSSHLFSTSISLLIISILLLRRLISNISSFFNSYQSLLKNREAHIYIEKIINSLDFIRDKNLRIKKINKFEKIEFINMNYYYKEGKKVFNNINFQIKKNDAMVIFGSSGSGKTTLINLITGLVKPTSGKLILNDMEQNNIEYNRNFKVGIVSQDDVIFNLSLLENLKLRNPKAKINEIIKFINLFGLTSLFKDGKIDLSLKINESSSNLSGGEKQRIAIIRELLLKPDLLILDEPSSALDQNNIQNMIKFFKKLKNQTTLIIFTHQSEYKSLPFKFYILKNKKIVQLQ